MGIDTTISVTLLISLISLGCSVFNTFSGGKKDLKAQEEKESARQLDIEKNFVKINVKLDDFCDTSKQMMEENAKKTDELKAVSEKLVLVTEKVNTLFKYKDNHEERIKDLEEKVK
jgi:hypothetical protein